MIVETINFTEASKNTIAEFVYNYDAKRCTKFHALMVLKVIRKHNWLDELEYQNFVGAVKMEFKGIMEKIHDIILKNVSTKQGGEMLKKYYV